MALSPVQVKLLKRLLVSGSEAKIAHALEKIHPADIAILFSEINPNQTQNLINSLFLVKKAGVVLSELPEFLLPDILEIIENDKMALILGRLEPDDALFLLQKMPESRWNKLLELLPEENRLVIEKLLLYPSGSAGSVMTSNFVTVKMDMTIDQAIASLRSHPLFDAIFYIYVVDENGRLVGVQSLRGLVISKKGTHVRDIMNDVVHAVGAHQSQEEAAQMVAQYNLLALPVVNDQRELLGVITVDDVIDIIKEEATEDIYHLAGLSEEDRATTPLFIKVKKRMPWMILNLFTAALAALVVGYFEESIREVVALAVFMPIVAGVGGNGAHQSLIVIARSIALGELKFIKAYKAILREVGNGLILGVVLGSLMGLVSYLWKGNPYFGMVLFLAMMLNLIFGGLMGAAVPITFQKMKLDPAVGTSVIVTMCTDVLGFFFFLGLATWMIGYLR